MSVHQNDESKGVSLKRGFPNPSTDSTIISLDVTELLVKHPSSTFFMRITGEDWKDLGIFDNDIAIVDRSLEPRNSDLVIWWEEQDFRISKLKDIPPETAVWGVVASIIHRYRNLSENIKKGGKK